MVYLYIKVSINETFSLKDNCTQLLIDIAIMSKVY